jgi:hypothetical protein
MWAAPAPAPRSRSRLPLIIGVIVAIVVLAGAGLFAYSYIRNNADAGKVVFSTDKPVAGQTTGCVVDNQVTSVPVGTSVYATYHFSSQQGSGVVDLSITKDGATFLSPWPMPTSDTQGYNCVADDSDFSTIFTDPGKYTVTLTSGGTTVAQGTLTVTP